MATFEKCCKSVGGALHLYLSLVKSTDKTIVIISVDCVLRLRYNIVEDVCTCLTRFSVYSYLHAAIVSECLMDRPRRIFEGHEVH